MTEKTAETQGIVPKDLSGSYTLTASVVVHSHIKISSKFIVQMKTSFSVHCTLSGKRNDSLYCTLMAWNIFV